MSAIAFIGLGEAASAIIQGWGADLPGPIRAFDIKSRDPVTRSVIAERARSLDVIACDSPEAAVSGADCVFSTVTADQAVIAASSVAGT